MDYLITEEMVKKRKEKEWMKEENSEEKETENMRTMEEEEVENTEDK